LEKLLGRVLSACNAPVSQTGEVPENAGKKVYSSHGFAQVCTELHD
jgi:hypothetical protein